MILSIISNYLGVSENAGQTIMNNIISILYSIPLGFSVGASALVGRNIGKGNILKAKLYIKEILLVSLMTSLAPCIFFLLCPETIIEIFTHD
jgi:Na+-driven multidrug efflux pump